MVDGVGQPFWGLRKPDGMDSPRALLLHGFFFLPTRSTGCVCLSLPRRETKGGPSGDTDHRRTLLGLSAGAVRPAPTAPTYRQYLLG